MNTCGNILICENHISLYHDMEDYITIIDMTIISNVQTRVCDNLKFDCLTLKKFICCTVKLFKLCWSIEVRTYYRGAVK